MRKKVSWNIDSNQNLSETLKKYSEKHLWRYNMDAVKEREMRMVNELKAVKSRLWDLLEHNWHPSVEEKLVTAYRCVSESIQHFHFNKNEVVGEIKLDKSIELW